MQQDMSLWGINSRGRDVRLKQCPTKDIINEGITVLQMTVSGRAIIARTAQPSFSSSNQRGCAGAIHRRKAHR